jgi:hypothetical protein
MARLDPCNSNSHSSAIASLPLVCRPVRTANHKHAQRLRQCHLRPHSLPRGIPGAGAAAGALSGAVSSPWGRSAPEIVSESPRNGKRSGWILLGTWRRPDAAAAAALWALLRSLVRRSRLRRSASSCRRFRLPWKCRMSPSCSMEEVVSKR